MSNTKLHINKDGILVPCLAKKQCRMKDEEGNPTSHYNSQDEFDNEMMELYGILHSNKTQEKTYDNSGFEEYMRKNLHQYSDIIDVMGINVNPKRKIDDYSKWIDEQCRFPKNSKFQTVSVSEI